MLVTAKSVFGTSLRMTFLEVDSTMKASSERATALLDPPWRFRAGVDVVPPVVDARHPNRNGASLALIDPVDLCPDGARVGHILHLGLRTVDLPVANRRPKGGARRRGATELNGRSCRVFLPKFWMYSYAGCYQLSHCRCFLLRQGHRREGPWVLYIRKMWMFRW